MGRSIQSGRKAVQNNIRTLRLAKRLSLEKLGEALNMTKSAVHRLETGGTRLKTDQLDKLAEALECAPEDIMPFKKGKHQLEAGRFLDPMLMQDIIALMLAWKPKRKTPALTPEQKARMIVALYIKAVRDRATGASAKSFMPQPKDIEALLDYEQLGKR